MRRPAGLAVAALVALLVSLSLTGAPAAAAEVTDSGWWWKVQTGQVVAVPVPPGMPDGALLVQGSVDEASAVAAVRYALSDTETGPVLVLRLAPGSEQAAATAVVLACATATAWRAGSAQPWTEKPQPDCSRQALGVPAPDGASMSFDLSSFAAAPVVDVVLVPGTLPDLPTGTNGSVFTLVFERPAAADLVTVAAGTPVTEPPFTPPTARPSTTPAAGSFPPPRPVTPLPSFRPPSVAVAPALPPRALAPPTAAAPAAPAADAGSAGAVPRVSFPVDEPGRGGARLVAVALLVIGAGAAFALGGRRATLLRLLGGVPADAASPLPRGGLGRFAREREGLPPSLL